MPFGKHLLDARALMEIKRYQNKTSFNKRSVAEHMWSVAKIAQGLALWEIHKFSNIVDMGRLLEKAINHDLIELSTGDIPSPTKKRSPKMKQALEETELCAYQEDIEPYLPLSWRNHFKTMILNPKSNDIEGLILKDADIIDTVIEAIQEIQLGNPNYHSMLLENLNELTKTNLQSTKYFIRYSFLDFGIDMHVFGDAFNSYRESLVFVDDIFNTNPF